MSSLAYLRGEKQISKRKNRYTRCAEIKFLEELKDDIRLSLDSASNKSV